MKLSMHICRAQPSMACLRRPYAGDINKTAFLPECRYCVQLTKNSFLWALTIF